MTRNEKIRKLANAIREYRGRTSSPVGAVRVEWLRTPHPHKIKRIRELLRLLKFDAAGIEAAVKQIDGFKSFDEFDKWIRILDAKTDCPDCNGKGWYEWPVGEGCGLEQCQCESCQGTGKSL